MNIASSTALFTLNVGAGSLFLSQTGFQSAFTPENMKNFFCIYSRAWGITPVVCLAKKEIFSLSNEPFGAMKSMMSFGLMATAFGTLYTIQRVALQRFPNHLAQMHLVARMISTTILFTLMSNSSPELTLTISARAAEVVASLVAGTIITSFFARALFGGNPQHQ